jgi:hypothetical protein
MNTTIVRILMKCKEASASTKTPIGKASHKVWVSKREEIEETKEKGGVMMPGW